MTGEWSTAAKLGGGCLAASGRSAEYLLYQRLSSRVLYHVGAEGARRWPFSAFWQRPIVRVELCKEKPRKVKERATDLLQYKQ